MRIYRLRTYQEYCAYAAQMADVYRSRAILEAHLEPRWRKSSKVKGYSWPAEQVVGFAVNASMRSGDYFNWRETLTCPITGLNNRMRATVQFFETELGPCPDDAIYLTEQTTAFYHYLKGRYPGMTGSEYLGSTCQSGALDERGLRNEDLTNLSFADETFKFLLSLDCFEHIPDFRVAFAECYRVLSSDGTMLWSVPFDRNRGNNLLRAYLSDDGSIVHLLPPEYHGDPLRSEGCLSFACFGWEMLEDVRRAGFDDVYALFYWSAALGYLGGEQTLFVAHKVK